MIPICDHCQNVVEHCDCPLSVVAMDQFLLRVHLYPERFGMPVNEDGTLQTPQVAR